MEKEAKQMIDLKRNLFKIDVRAQKDEEKVFMRTAWLGFFFTCLLVLIVVSL
nr:exfoliative toxin [Streptococcus pyogenes]